MTLLARLIALVAATACFIALPMLAGCSDRESEDAASGARVWIPEAAIRAFPLGAGVNVAQVPGSSPRRDAITVIDQPSTRKGSLPLSWTQTYPIVDQEVLARSVDGRFYSANYVWKLDPLLENCAQSPSLCSSFTQVRTLSEDEAKALLRHSAQYTPARYRDLFGSSPSGANT